MLKQAFWLLMLPLHALAGQGHTDDHLNEHVDQLIQPIPQNIEVDKAIAKLGWILFRDPNLSSNQAISCESCHHLQTNGAELTRVSTGVNGQGLRNSLTVFNAALNYRFFLGWARQHFRSSN